MSMNLYVHSMHKVETTSVGVNGWDDCEDFMSRLNDYCCEIGADTPNQTGWGEGWATWEIPVQSIKEVLEQDDDFFIEIGRLEDRAIIQGLYDKADKKGNDYIYFDAF